jgi:hypothetical protein
MGYLVDSASRYPMPLIESVIPNSMADSVTTVHLQKLAQFLVDLD